MLNIFYIRIFSYFQIKSLGARLDLRTLIHGILNPTEIRSVMSTAQKSRSLYYQLRVCFIYIDAYTSIRMIFVGICLRRSGNSGDSKSSKEKYIERKKYQYYR